MRKLWRFSAAVSLAALTGCSSGSWLSNPLALGKSKPGTNLSAAPSFDKNYDEIASLQRDRKVSSSGLGMDQEVEPGAAKKLSRSVTDNSMTKGIKSAWNKTTKGTANLLTPRKTPPPNSISVFNDDGGEADAGLFVALARHDRAKNNMAAAEKHYLEALKLEPTNKEALLELARVHDGQGNLAEAMSYYKKAVAAHPQDATAHNDLGLCFARQNRLQDAAKELEKAITLAPDKPLYRNNIAKVLVVMGYPEPALAHLAKAHGEPTAHYNLGCLLYEQGEAEAALEHFSLAYAQDRSLTDAYQWAVAVQNELQPQSGQAIAANRAPNAAALASDEVRVAQAPASAAPSLTPSWASDADRSTFPAAAPSPDGANGYAPVETDPSAFGPANGDSTHRLPPVDTAYRAPNRY